MDNENKEVKQHTSKEPKIPKDKETYSEDSQGNYMSLGMCMGMCLGMTVGQIIFENLATGLSVGMCLGLAIGTSIKRKQ